MCVPKVPMNQLDSWLISGSSTITRDIAVLQFVITETTANSEII